jgi:rRNA biogenesis protein RRP5
LTLDNIEVDMEVTGVVKAVTNLGVFVNIDKCFIPALSHPNQARETEDEDLSTLYAVGDKVKAKVLKVDKEKKRITLGLKPSLFTEENEDRADVNMQEADDENKGAQNGDGDKDDEESEAEEKSGATSMDVDEEDETTGDAELEQEQKRREKAAAETLSISSTFEWDGIVFKDSKATKDSKTVDEEDDEEQNVGEGETSRKKNKKLKAKEREEQEKQVSKMEEDLLDPHRMPQTADDYERLLLASPNSSFLWIKFMAFQLGMTEIDKARAIAERALES